jgi:hypothetical protein
VEVETRDATQHKKQGESSRAAATPITDPLACIDGILRKIRSSTANTGDMKATTEL